MTKRAFTGLISFSYKTLYKVVTSMEFTREPNRFFFNDEQGKLAGEITFPAINDGQTWVIEHTFVRDDFGHQGLAGQLTQAVIDAARAEDKQIQPLCTYAKAYFDRHPEAGDVLATQS
ncbi:GNAT family N-acetyltransferase [Lactiplantibacillus plajomi]|uniref:GNAT family N-acetyltransferase n=1 Tax=Lactiplantibacillus plajomi TaxID=1457217 RepID=UPI003CD091DC